MTSNDDSAYGAPTSAGAGSSDEATTVPAPTEAAAELAWSRGDDTDEPTRLPLAHSGGNRRSAGPRYRDTCGRGRHRRLGSLAIGAAAPTARTLAAANRNISGYRSCRAAADRRHADISYRHARNPPAADDQRLFANVQQYGYPIVDPGNVARVAHTYCHALQRAESSEQADAEAARLLANPADETAITAAAMLALPHCNG